MTIASDEYRVAYSGDGGTVSFTVPFYFLANSHLAVVLGASGVFTELELDTDYTVTGAGDESGGAISMTVAPAVGETLSISRNVPLTQETDYPEGDPFPAATHERALDKLTMLTQQLKDATERSIHFDTGYTGGASTVLPSPSALAYLRWNSTGTALENAEDLASSTTFLQSGTGAVIRTMNAKVAEIYSVTDFGATGDGTTNDTSFIQAAIDAASQGDAIFFPNPAVAYMVSGDILLKQGVEYYGEHWKQNPIKLINNSDPIGILVSERWYNNASAVGNPISIHDLAIDGNSDNNSTGHGIILMDFLSKVRRVNMQHVPQKGIYTTNTKRNLTEVASTILAPHIEDCRILDTGEECIYSYRCTDGWLVNTSVGQNATGNQVDIDGTAAGWRIIESHCNKGANNGIRTDKGFNILIQGNIVDDFGGVGTTANPCSGISVENISNNGNVSIANNTITGYSKGVSDVSWSGGTATYTTSADHDFLNGNTVVVDGVYPSGYSTTGTITSIPATNQFTVAIANPVISITNATWAAGSATYTANSHGMAVGLTVKTQNITPSGYNVTGAITAVSANTFTVAVTSNPGAYSSGGDFESVSHATASSKYAGASTYYGIYCSTNAPSAPLVSITGNAVDGANIVTSAVRIASAGISGSIVSNPSVRLSSATKISVLSGATMEVVGNNSTHTFRNQINLIDAQFGLLDTSEVTRYSINKSSWVNEWRDSSGVVDAILGRSAAGVIRAHSGSSGVSSGVTLTGIVGSATYDPPNLADGAGASTTVTATGAALGDYAIASFSLDTQGITVTANVTSANTVTVRFQNETGGAIDLASGTLRVRVFPI